MKNALRCTWCDKCAEAADRQQKCQCGGRFMYPIRTSFEDDPFVVSSWETIKEASEKHERERRGTHG